MGTYHGDTPEPARPGVQVGELRLGRAKTPTTSRLAVPPERRGCWVPVGGLEASPRGYMGTMVTEEVATPAAAIQNADPSPPDASAAGPEASVPLSVSSRQTWLVGYAKGCVPERRVLSTLSRHPAQRPLGLVLTAPLPGAPQAGPRLRTFALPDRFLKHLLLRPHPGTAWPPALPAPRPTPLRTSRRTPRQS